MAPTPLTEVQEQHHATLSLLEAVFPLKGELTTLSGAPISDVLPDSAEALQLPFELVVALSLSLDAALGSLAETQHALRLGITLPPSSTKASLNLYQPAWLGRVAHRSLADELEVRWEAVEPEEGVLETIEWLRERAREVVIEAREKAEADAEANREEVVEVPLFRVFFWFPSLSTRDKRDQMVNWAAGYHLTGFMLAGKPAILCLEGASKDINEYMSEVKTVSWADVPSFQKKVSERDREPITTRIFPNMIEITHLIEKGGQRGNRGDMGQVRDWMTERGLGEAFENVVGGGFGR